VPCTSLSDAETAMELALSDCDAVGKVSGTELDGTTANREESIDSVGCATLLGALMAWAVDEGVVTAE